MRLLIMAYNRKVLDTQEKEKRVNDCRKQQGPFNGKCLTLNLIYKAP